MEFLLGSFERFVVAVDRVEKLLTVVAAALNEAGAAYAVIGGNAIAAWVASVDEGAVRTTKDVDVLVRRGDLATITEALGRVDLMPVEVLGVHMFVHRENPNPKTGVHIVIAGEKIRPHYPHPAPDPSRFIAFGQVRVVELSALLAMKLQAYRFIDRAHVQDLLSVGLISAEIRRSLPPDLRERLEEIENDSMP